MGLEFSFQDKSNYLLVRVRGVPDDKDFRGEGLMTLREKATKAGTTRILIDAIEVPSPKTGLKRFIFGKSFSEQIRPPLKVAILYKAEFIDKFTENTAVNRGANLYVCSDEAEALQWLLGSLPNTAS